jgi:hypothetical protein
LRADSETALDFSAGFVALVFIPSARLMRKPAPPVAAFGSKNVPSKNALNASGLSL